MTVKTQIEEAVEALPAEYQQRMAGYVLAGWKFYSSQTPNPLRHGGWWLAECQGRPVPSVSGRTLYSLLDKMRVQDRHSEQENVSTT